MTLASYDIPRLPHSNIAALAAVVPAWLPWNPGLHYLLGTVILIIGLITAFKSEAFRSRGLDKLIAFGPVFFAVPLAVFAADHFVFAQGIATMIPRLIPAHLFWAYFVGACLLCAALSLVTGKLSGLAAALFGIMIFLFELLISIPRVVAAPGDRIIWAVCLRDFAFSAGALAFAATHTAVWKTHGKHPVVTVARFFIAIPILFFAVEHFLHPHSAPGVPLALQLPAWIPLHLLIDYLTAAIFLITGLCLLINKKARLAATVLGLTVLLQVLLIYAPILASDYRDIANGLNYFGDTLLLSAAALLLAASQPQDPVTQSV
ncbi:MAG TPA: hypothetical protein VGI46_09080 [Candidatus Acidoferrum sp.]